MAIINLLYLLLISLPSSLCICLSGKSTIEEFHHTHDLGSKKEQTFPCSSSNGRKVLNLSNKLDDSINPIPTTFPSTTPTTNPANFPPYTPTPTIITVPGSNPTNPVPPPPSTNTPAVPITNPTAPVTNPATTYPTPASTVPATTNPPAQTNAPVVPGQTWCIARAGVPETSLQEALDYACGIGGADCSTIQQGGGCYNPNTIENHASYAFNSYFQRNPVASSCDFGGTAVVVNTNPSSGTCIYPSSATGTAMPASMIPPATSSSTGATGSSPGVAGSGYSYGPPPAVFNTGNAGSTSPTIYGSGIPPTGDSVPSAGSGPAALRPFIGFIILVVSLSTGKLSMG